MKIVDFPSNLFFHTDPRRSAFLKEMKRIFLYFGMGFNDPCCTNNPPFPAGAVCTDDVTILGDGLPGSCLTLGPICHDATLIGTGLPGDCLGINPAGASAGTYAMFYGLTAGTGNPSTTDYAATIPVKTAAGTGRVPFPRLTASGPGGATNIDGSSFNLPNIGVYQVSFTVQTTEAGQLELELNNADVIYTDTGNMNPTSGGHLFSGTFLIVTTIPNSVLAVINPAGNSSALTITPADGSQTHANAQTLVIRQIA